MRKSITSVRSYAIILFVILMCGITGPVPVFAQTAPDENAGRADLPLIALFPPQPASAQKREEPDRALFETLRGMLVSSNRFRVVSYSPNHPLIKRALLEHTLAASDLAREPLSPDLKHQVARLLGATYILSLKATQKSEGLQTDAHCEQAIGQQDWRTLFMEQMTTAATSGRKRLKFADVVRVASDGIITRLGLPSQLEASLRGKAEEPAPPKKEPVKIAAKNEEKPPKQENPQKPERQKPPRQNTSTKSTKKPEDVPNENPTPPVKQPAEQKTSRIDKPQPDPPQRVVEKPVSKPEKNTSAVAKNEATFAPFSTDSAPARNTNPATPVVTTPPSTARPDFEAEAIRYRQAGDLANVITSLRHAINDRPRDSALRRQLVQAYMERRMMESALSETERALVLSPEDAGLHRLHGDTLLAKADVPGAQKAYREAMRLAPNDITAQVALGDTLMADNQFAEALKAYAEAVKSDSKSPLPHRRLARALAGRAASDPKYYAESLAEVEQARKLTPPADTQTYLEDYIALIRLMEMRLRDMVTELQGNYTAKIQSKQSDNQLIRAAQDMKERAQVAADFLDKLPAAVGQDATHARYQQSAALLIQAISLLREWLMTGETRTEDALKSAQTDILRELSTASKRLDAARPKS